MVMSLQIVCFQLITLLILIETTLGQVKDATTFEATLPRIEQKNFKLIPSENQYLLSINLPNHSERMEFVDSSNSAMGTAKELSVMGTIKQQYADTGANTLIVYTADKRGYVFSYRYQTMQSKRPAFEVAPIMPLFLSPTALKTLN